MYQLTILPPEGEPLQYDMGSDPVTIGRAPECDLVVDDAFLSRSHVRLYTDDDDLMVEDLGSSNGTLVNGVRITEVTKVTHGDMLLISGTHVSITHPVDLSEPGAVAAEAPAGVTALRPLSELLPQSPQQEAAARADGAALEHYADRLKLLNEVHRALGMSAELDELLELVLDGAFEHLGPENAVILLVDEDGELRQAASRPTEEEDGGEGLPISQTLANEVVGKGQAALAVDVSSDERFADAKSIIASGARSLLAAPLLDSEGCLGMIALFSNLQKKIFSEEDMELLASLASVAALRIRNVSLAKRAAERERLEREVALARRVQESLLPKKLPDLDGYEMDASNIPSRGVSGDFYQVMQRGENGECVVIVVDVSGKGMAASLLSVGLDTAISVLVEAGIDKPDQILQEANNLLYRKTPPDKFATAVMAILDPQTGKVQFVNAGHNPPLLVRASGEVTELKATGFPLAMLPDGEYSADELTLEPGDLLALFTDGIVEAENPADEEFQLDRFVEAMMNAVHGDIVSIRESVDSELERFVEGVPYRDDRTLVLIRRLAQ